MKVTAENNTLHEVHRYAINKNGKVVYTHLMPVCTSNGMTVYAPYDASGQYNVHKTETLAMHPQDQRSGGWERTKAHAKKSLLDSIRGEQEGLKARLTHADDLLTLVEGIRVDEGSKKLPDSPTP